MRTGSVGSMSPIILQARRTSNYASASGLRTSSGMTTLTKSEGNELGGIEVGEGGALKKEESMGKIGEGEGGLRDSQSDWEILDREEMSFNERLREAIRLILDNNRTHTIVMILLIIMGASLGIQASVPVSGALALYLSYLDNLLVLIFTLEVVLRLYAMGFAFFLDGWNWFDLIVVALSLVPIVLLMFDSLDDSYNLAIFRILRVFRLLRILRSSKHLRLIIESLGKSLPNLGWILFFLVVVFYVFGLIGTHAFGEVFKDWFGNLGRSMYTLFQVMTLESWSMGIARPVMEVYPYAWTFFVPFILIATYTTMNIFIAIIVTTMQNAQADMLREEIDLKLGERDLAEEGREMRMMEELNILRREMVDMKDSFNKQSRKLVKALSISKKRAKQKANNNNKSPSPGPMNSQLLQGSAFDGNSAALPVPIPSRERRAVHPCVSTLSSITYPPSPQNT